MLSSRKAQAQSETATKQSFSIHYQYIKLILQAVTRLLSIYHTDMSYNYDILGRN